MDKNWECKIERQKIKSCLIMVDFWLCKARVFEETVPKFSPLVGKYFKLQSRTIVD